MSSTPRIWRTIDRMRGWATSRLSSGDAHGKLTKPGERRVGDVGVRSRVGEVLLAASGSSRHTPLLQRRRPRRLSARRAPARSRRCGSVELLLASARASFSHRPAGPSTRVDPSAPLSHVRPCESSVTNRALCPIWVAADWLPRLWPTLHGISRWHQIAVRHWRAPGNVRKS